MKCSTRAAARSATGSRATGRAWRTFPDALDANDDAIVALARGVDVLVRGAPFLAEESERADLFGHGTIEHAIEIAQAAGARRLIVTHHGPMPHRRRGRRDRGARTASNSRTKECTIEPA